MSADILTPAILNYINHGNYPESEDVASATLQSSALPALLIELRRAQDEVKNEIRGLSRTAAPDIDEWIARAKELQSDILRSRDTARQIVQEAEAGEKVKAELDDTGKKVALLEREVAFNETLTGTLEHIQYANGLLDKAQNEAVKGEVERALQKLEDAEASIASLGSMEDGRAVGLLHQRAAQLREGLVETATECWNALISVNVEEKMLRIQREGLQANVPDATVPEISLGDIVVALQTLGVFDSLLLKLSRDIDRAILRPRIIVDDDGQIAKISVSDQELICSGKSNDLSPASLFNDLYTLIDFLSSRLLTSISKPLSSTLIPALTSRLETHWLDPAIPVSVSDIQQFESLLEHVERLISSIEKYDWHGAQGLIEWIENAPRTWLTKRREIVLGEVRNLVFMGLKERKVVERVETRMMKNEDAGVVGQGGASVQGAEDDWDTAWDEAQGEDTPAAQLKREQQDEDEESSAWDMDDDDPLGKEGRPVGDADEDDAWGWGDEDPSSPKPPSPVATKKQPPQTASKTNGQPAAEQEMTLRETFTVTAIPDGILTIIQQIIRDAEILSGPEFEDALIAPAASALYTLPTLALAIYRATAPTAYSKVDTGIGNMLIYNDTSRLADQLRSWQESQPQGSRLKVDNDVAALETFAKRAYSSEMEAQRTVLRDLLDGAQGFGNCTQQPFRRECEGAVDSAVDRLRDVHNLWKDILSQGALLQSLGSLLATVTGKMITEIEELGDISEPESLQLKALCDRVSTIKSLFTTRAEGEPSSAGSSEAGQDMTFIYCPTWLKFQYLPEILEGSLADIKWMWKEGELSLEFGAEEVVELVEALFTESDLRKGAVREIRRAR